MVSSMNNDVNSPVDLGDLAPAVQFSASPSTGKDRLSSMV